MSFSTECNRIFWANTLEYRRLHDVNATFSNPYPPATMQALLCEKNWIDNVQWDLEDIIRNPDIDPAEALGIKRRIAFLRAICKGYAQRNRFPQYGKPCLGGGSPLHPYAQNLPYATSGN